MKRQEKVMRSNCIIKEFHRNGIEVILDVVFNHTAEGKKMEKYFLSKVLIIRYIICSLRKVNIYNFSAVAIH